MGTYIAKIKGNNDQWYKMAAQVTNDDYSRLPLDDALLYDANNTMSDQWFKLADFNNYDAFLRMLDLNFDAVDLEDLSRAQYDQIEFIAYYDDSKYYIQNVTKGSYLEKKWFSFDGQVMSFETKDNLIYINSIPHCVYNQIDHSLYFMNISKAFAIFSGLRLDYRQATNEEVTDFLNSDIINVVNFDCSKVGLSNRKRINAIKRIYEGYEPDEKDRLKKYIHDSVGEVLGYNARTKQFTIDSDSKLRVLLMGIQQRFYIPPLNEEVQVATNTTSLANLLG